MGAGSGGGDGASLPPVDPELRASLPLPRLAEVGLARARALAPVAEDAALSCGGRFEVSHQVVPGPPGGPELAVVVCLPSGRDGAPVPALYHVHGGGMVTGNRTSGLERVLGWAGLLGIAVVSVEYRLAPETPHPGPVEDCYAGLVWLAAHAARFGIDPDRLVVEGMSAGGGLAAAMLLLARDRGGPAVAAQLLGSPMLDDRNDTVSARQSTGSVWDWRDNELGWTALLGAARGGADVPAYAAPARATDLAGLPATFIDAGSAEIFRDEAVDYACRIWQAGGDCELHVWPGGFHTFAGVAPGAILSRAADEAVIGWLRRVLRVVP